MQDLPLHEMSIDDLDKISDIDRTEQVDALYTQIGSRILLKPVKQFVGRWSNMPETVEFCREHMRAGAEAFGVSDGDKLVGIVIITPNIEPGVAQLAFLHVSAAYRRKGIASRLMEVAMERARRQGHKAVYVTASPTRSAQGFYGRAGFVPTENVIPRLFTLEPRDIHMVAVL